MRKACLIPRSKTTKAAPASCPIWVQKVSWILEAKHGPLFKFRCGVGLKSARFASKDGTAVYRVLHKSTKYKGKWQLSSFDDQGAIMDMGGTCDELLDETRPKSWRLVEVKAK